MDEREWNSGTRLYPFLQFVRGTKQYRQWRLVACACVREDWDCAPEAARAAIEAGEAYADRRIHRAELRRAKEVAHAVFEQLCQPSRACETARRAAWVADPSHVNALEQVIFQGVASEGERGLLVEARRCALIRDLFGNPFRPVALDPAWRTPTVTALATAAYEERILPAGHLDRDRLAVLADALEDAGCTNIDILEHLRSEGPHARGCWLLDLVLNKK